MKRLLLLFLPILFLGFDLVVYAQETVCLNEDGQWCDRNQVKEHALINKSDNTTKVEVFPLNGIRKEMTGYSNYAENKVECIKDGSSITFYTNGQVEAEKVYEKNHLKSLKAFYSGGNLQREDFYKKGKLQKKSCMTEIPKK